MLAAEAAFAQNSAMWTAAAGNWNTATNWGREVNGIPSGPCVPGAGYFVNTQVGDITLDVDATVARIVGFGGSLTLNTRTLTATDPLGIQVFGTISLQGGSTINSAILGANTLNALNSTINGGATASAVNLSGSTVSGAVTATGELTMLNSSAGGNSNVIVTSASSIASSTIIGQFSVEMGATLTLDSSSAVQATQALVVGGALNVQGASTLNLSSSPLAVGLAPGASSVDVTGVGSVIDLNNTALELGQIGNATVTVENRGAIAASGAGGNIFVGLGDVNPFVTQSQMFVQTGGVVTAHDVEIAGSSAGSTAMMQVVGSGSSVTASGHLLIYLGGELNVNQGASFTADTLDVQSGKATVDTGSTLTLNSSSDALVGSKETGTLTLQSASTGFTPGRLIVGADPGSQGTLNVTDAGSKFQAGSTVVIGDMGSGTLLVRGESLLENVADAGGLGGVIAAQAGSSGTVNVQLFASWQMNGTLQVGAGGTGTLNLASGGQVESKDAVIGVNFGSTGTVTVSDAQSKLTVNGTLTVGSAGTASLNVINGGQVASTAGVIGGTSEATSSTVAVAGAGSRWDMTGNLTVGMDGTGTLTLAAGGVVADLNGVVGAHTGSSGTVAVSGFNSTWNNSGQLQIGPEGDGSLTVDSGGKVTAASMVIGGTGGANVVIGPGGTLSVQNDLTVAGFKLAELRAEAGGTITSGSGVIGGASGSGTVEISGSGSTWGTGAITIGTGGALDIVGGQVNATTVTVNPGGSLLVQGGAIFGDVVNNGGLVTPGDATGTMTVTGNYTQNDGTLVFELDGLGPAQFDQLVVSGLANLLGGSIDIVFGNGFLPADGEQFNLITAGQGLTLSGVSLSVTGLPAGLQFSDVLGPNGLQLGFNSTPQTGAPEPVSMGMLMLGLAAMAAKRASVRRGRRGEPRTRGRGPRWRRPAPE